MPRHAPGTPNASINASTATVSTLSPSLRRPKPQLPTSPLKSPSSLHKPDENHRPPAPFATTVPPLTTPAQHTIQAGAAYFAIVFAVGFVLGAVRTLFITPALGELLAVLIELPFILGASWLACGWVLRRWPVAPAAGPRLQMGAVAFVLLILAEVILSLAAFDRSPAEFLRNLTTPHGLTGLFGQGEAKD